jgi:hypothetical protein
VILFQSYGSNGVFGQHVPLDLTNGCAKIADLNFAAHFAADHRITCITQKMMSIIFKKNEFGA